LYYFCFRFEKRISISLSQSLTQKLMGKEYLVGGRLVGKDMGETSCLSVLGGVHLSQVGFTVPPPIPSKL
jgi:hypothetical protein